MKKSILIYLLIILSKIHFCYGCNTELSAEINHEFSIKHYIQADQILLCEEGFIIQLDKMYLLAKEIFHDDEGFYYLYGVSWICRNCGALNDLDNVVCYRCKE